ncbi:MAG: hypothetical protein O4805_16410 [Trichodesmium sp. St16_bin2-tuft]|nr:hypothetical protein [Trichodesmium sp. MAG_R02]MDE5088628.1 hypothetical protein [Trichodesmium sp. St16_bin2-tuft]
MLFQCLLPASTGYVVNPTASLVGSPLSTGIHGQTNRTSQILPKNWV